MQTMKALCYVQLGTNVKKFFDRWVSPITGILMIFILIAVLIGYAPMRAAFCDPNESCIREWVSALSGWAGALVTLLTLLVLWRQILLQERQHRELVFATKAGELDALRAIVDYCDSLMQLEDSAKTRGRELDAPPLNVLYRVSMHTSHSTSHGFGKLCELVGAYNETDRKAVAIYGDPGDGSTSHGYQCVLLFGKVKVLRAFAQEQIDHIMLAAPG